jgi:aspartate--ammonia ligase
MNSFVPAGYKSTLGIYDTQKAIGLLKRIFADRLAGALTLHRVSAPLFVQDGTGINDDLNGVERPVEFDIAHTQINGQVVQSLAKWKRIALKRYEFYPGKGLYADMNAIRRDEEMDNLHSIYVDQWDWEKVIERADRKADYLKSTVISIVEAICETQETLHAMYPELALLGKLSRRVTFISTQELEDMYPELTPRERENAAAKEHGTIFIMGVGGALRSGKAHDGRAPDYDDWSLNGDIMFWYEPLGCALEISSMGVRVDETSLDEQLRIAGCDNRRELYYHKLLLDGKLPLTIGGGIGQSRLSMLLLGKIHIGEVQVSVWDEQTQTVCAEAGVVLL